MPDIIRLRYVGPTPVMVAVLGRTAEPDSVVDFPGRFLPVDEGADHYLIETGNPPEVRAWPTSRWRDETPVSTKAEE